MYMYYEKLFEEKDRISLLLIHRSLGLWRWSGAPRPNRRHSDARRGHKRPSRRAVAATRLGQVRML